MAGGRQRLWWWWRCCGQWEGRWWRRPGLWERGRRRGPFYRQGEAVERGGADGRPVLCARAVMVAGAGAASWR